MKEYLNLFIREKLKALGSEDRFMSKVRIFRHGSTAWIGVHPNKINIILENQPIEISVTADELDHIAYHCLKSAMEIRQDKTIYKQEKSCLHFKTYGPRTNCKQTFIPVKSSHLHCSDGCRAVYNQKQIREKRSKAIHDRIILKQKIFDAFFILLGARLILGILVGFAYILSLGG